MATGGRSITVGGRGASLLAVAVAVCAILAAPAQGKAEGRATTGVLRPSPDSPTAAVATEPYEQRYPWLLPRAAQDRPDDIDGRQVHVVYLVPADMPDEGLDELGVLDLSLRSMNAWLQDESGGLRWRLDTFAIAASDDAEMHALDVTFVRSNLPASAFSGISEVEDELGRHGLATPSKRYLSFVASDGGGTCGVAWVPGPPIDPDVPPDGQFAAVFLKSPAGCHPGAFATSLESPSWAEATALHELLHNDGMVPLGAPNTCATSINHICNVPLMAASLDPEWLDVMYVYATAPLSQRVLDRNRDDYFGHGLPIHSLEDSAYLERP